jgi:hypothetical protein
MTFACGPIREHNVKLHYHCRRFTMCLHMLRNIPEETPFCGMRVGMPRKAFTGEPIYARSLMERVLPKVFPDGGLSEWTYHWGAHAKRGRNFTVRL